MNLSFSFVKVLQQLYVDMNQLSGSLQSEVCQLSGLTALHAHSNVLSGSLPSELWELTRMSTLHIHSNRLSGYLPQTTRRANQSTNALEWLYLANNSLSGTLMSISSPNLSYVALSDNRLSGEALRVLLY